MSLRILLTEVLGYLGFLAFVNIENPVLVGLFIAIAAGSFLGFLRFFRQVWDGIVDEFKRNEGQAAAIAFVLALTFPFLLVGNTYWLQIANLAMLYAVMALGLNFMTGRAGLVCLGYAAFVAIGAYVVGILTLKFAVSFWPALLLAGLTASLFGVVLGLPALRVKGHYLALVTIAFGLIIQELLLNMEEVTGGTNGLINIPSPHLFGYDLGSPMNLGFAQFPFQANFYYLSLIILAVSIWLVYRLSHSFFGLALNAMREDQLAAQCYGLNLTSYKLLAFAVGAFFGGIVGGVYAGMINFIAPENFGYQQSVLVLSMIIFGGLDSIPGAVLGAVFLTVFPEKFRAFEDFRLLFYGVIIVLCLLFMREGIAPFKRRIFIPKSEEQEGEHATAECAGSDNPIRGCGSGR
ncbi:MAG: urea transporter, permease protein UrtC [Anaerosporomusa subterranea]|jgi:branched-chain amino acid transport system permease protein|nr:urea transporter, permease protein UrtC [Anaerosporomusa subterranea]